MMACIQEIQEVLVRSANDLISLDAPNYQYAAARLLSYGVNKDVFGEYTAITLQQNIHLILIVAYMTKNS